MLLMMNIFPFNKDEISDFDKSQIWNVENGKELLANCTHKIIISDFMSATMYYKERCELLVSWLEIAISLFPNCKAIWIPSSGKLLTPNMVINNNVSAEDKFIYLFVNVRLFNIEDTEDKVIDTLGLYSIGLPDVQYHYHGLNPNHVVEHAYNVASYIFNENSPIKNGETIDGIENGIMNREIRWTCHYEKSLIQPVRDVLDINTGEYASGKRV